MKDQFGFEIWEDEDHLKWWDQSKKITIEDLLLGSKFEPDKYNLKNSLPFDFKIADDEKIWEYKYGGMLSSRGGYFITKKDKPFWILRSKMTWMS